MHDPYAINATDHISYDKMFRDFDEDKDGYLSGSEVVKVFSQSGLDVEVLRKVWELADVDKDSKLNSKEFAVGFHLIVCVRNKKLPLPDGLTPGLLNFLANAPDMPQEQPVGIQTLPPMTGATSATTPATAAAAETLVSVAQQPTTRPQTMSIDDAFSNIDSDLSNANDISRNRTRTTSSGSHGDSSIAPTTVNTPIPSSSSTTSSPMPISMPPVGSGQVNEINDSVQSVLDSSKRAMAIQQVASETTEKAVASLKALSVKLGTEKVSMSASLNGAEQHVEEMERRLASVLQDVTSMSEQNESLRAQLKEITSKQFGTEQSLFTAREQQMTLTKENEALQADIAAAERGAINVSMKLGESTEALKNANASTTAHNVEVNKVTEEISTLQSEIASLRSINELLMTRKSGLSGELEGLQQRAIAAESAVILAQEKAKEMESKVNILTKEKESLQHEKSIVIAELAVAMDAAEVAKPAAESARKEAETLIGNAKLEVGPVPTPTIINISTKTVMPPDIVKLPFLPTKTETVMPAVETKKEEVIPILEKTEAEVEAVVKPPTPPPEVIDDPFANTGLGTNTGSNGGSGDSLSSLGDVKDPFADSIAVENSTSSVADSTSKVNIETDPFVDTGLTTIAATSESNTVDPFGDVTSPTDADSIDPFGNGNGPTEVNSIDPFGDDTPAAVESTVVSSTDPFGDGAAPEDSTDPFTTTIGSTEGGRSDPFSGDAFGASTTASAPTSTVDPFGGDAFGEVVVDTDANTGNAFGEFNAFGAPAATETDSSKATAADPFATADFGAFDDTANTDVGSISTDAFASFPDANGADKTNLDKAFDAF